MLTRSAAAAAAAQVMTWGRRMSLEEMEAAIDRHTPQSLTALARRVLSGKPSVAMLGNVNHCTGYEDVQKWLA